MSTVHNLQTPLKSFKTMTQFTPHTPGKITATGNDRCRFDMFTRQNPKYTKPGQKPEWCYRGDKYTSDPLEFLPSLVRMFKNHFYKWQLAELYDNTRPVTDPERIVLRYKNGVVEINRLSEYSVMLQRIVLPEMLL